MEMRGGIRTIPQVDSGVPAVIEWSMLLRGKGFGKRDWLRRVGYWTVRKREGLAITFRYG
jgi:hypothetical protein